MPHVHAFDPVSGYCAWCGYRDDGRLIDIRTGTEYQKPRDERTETTTHRSTA